MFRLAQAEAEIKRVGLQRYLIIENNFSFHAKDYICMREKQTFTTNKVILNGEIFIKDLYKIN